MSKQGDCGSKSTHAHVKGRLRYSLWITWIVKSLKCCCEMNSLKESLWCKNKGRRSLRDVSSTDCDAADCTHPA